MRPSVARSRGGLRRRRLACVAGADIAESVGQRPHQRRLGAVRAAVFRSFETAPKTTVAAVTGSRRRGRRAAMACHFRMPLTRKVRQTESTRHHPGYGCTQRLPRRGLDERSAVLKGTDAAHEAFDRPRERRRVGASSCRPYADSSSLAQAPTAWPCDRAVDRGIDMSRRRPCSRGASFGLCARRRNAEE